MLMTGEVESVKLGRRAGSHVSSKLKKQIGREAPVSKQVAGREGSWQTGRHKYKDKENGRQINKHTDGQNGRQISEEANKTKKKQ